LVENSATSRLQHREFIYKSLSGNFSSIYIHTYVKIFLLYNLKSRRKKKNPWAALNLQTSDLHIQMVVSYAAKENKAHGYHEFFT